MDQNYGFFLRRPSAEVPFISHYRAGCWLVLKDVRPELPTESQGTPRGLFDYFTGSDIYIY